MRDRHLLIFTHLFSNLTIGLFLTFIVHNISKASDSKFEINSEPKLKLFESGVEPNKGEKLPTISPTRTCAIGDIHADIDGLEEILQVSGSIDSQGHLERNLELVFMGDMVGMGPDSPSVIKRIMQLKKEALNKNSSVILLAGNHEINLLANRFNYISKIDQEHWRLWLNPLDYWKESIYQALRSPESLSQPIQHLRNFYQSLVPWHQTRGKFLVHSGISKRMLSHSSDSEIIEFKNKIQLILNGQHTLGSNDWLFGPEGPTLTSQTADPEIAEFILDSKLETNQFFQFLEVKQVNQIWVGHWTSHKGILEHSNFGSRLLHLDTGISSPKGMLSYIELTSRGEVLHKSWRRGEASFPLNCMSALK